MARDRVTELRRVRAGDLEPHPANWRGHPENQQAAMKGILDEVGWSAALVAYEHDGGLRLIDGHLRAGIDPDEEVPVLVLDVDDEEAAKLLVSLDPISAMAQADKEGLRALLDSVQVSDEGLGRMLADLARSAAPPRGEDTGPMAPPAAPKTKPGDMYVLGRHRLLCGDVWDEEAWDRLIGTDTVEMVFTDPPYNVAYGDSKQEPTRPIEGDRQGDAEWIAFNRHLARMFRARCAGDVYCFGASSPDGMRQRLTFVEEGCHWSATIIWKKQQLVLTPANYQRMYEPCFYGWFGRSSFNSDRTQVEVWEFDRPHDSPLHPTMKPLDLCAHAIQNSSVGGGAWCLTPSVAQAQP